MEQKKELTKLQAEYDKRWLTMVKEHLATKSKIEQDYRNYRHEIAEEETAFRKNIKIKKKNASMAFSELMRDEFDDFHKRMVEFVKEWQEAFSKFAKIEK